MGREPYEKKCQKIIACGIHCSATTLKPLTLECHSSSPHSAVDNPGIHVDATSYKPSVQAQPDGTSRT